MIKETYFDLSDNTHDTCISHSLSIKHDKPYVIFTSNYRDYDHSTKLGAGQTEPELYFQTGWTLTTSNVLITVTWHLPNQGLLSIASHTTLILTISTSSSHGNLLQMKQLTGTLDNFHVTSQILNIPPPSAHEVILPGSRYTAVATTLSPVPRHNESESKVCIINSHKTCNHCM